MKPVIDITSLNERKVGDKLTCTIRGEEKTIVAYPSSEAKSSCEGCIFKNSNCVTCLPFVELLGPCESTERSDHKDIIFKEVLPDQFELMRTIICRQALEWLRQHPNQTKFHLAVYFVTKELFPIESAIIRNSSASIAKNKENLTPFWEKLKELINKKMKPITVEDFIEYLQTFPKDYELHCFNDGEPIRVTNSETNHEQKMISLHFE